MKVTIIAECGINFGSIEQAKLLIWHTHKRGADLAKLQLYSVDDVFPSKEIIVSGRNWYPEVRGTQLSKNQAGELFEYGKEIGIDVFFSTYDLERLAWCEELGVKRYKLGCRSVNDTGLIESIIKTGKELIVSIPYGSLLNASPLLVQYRRIKKLYCIPEYPTKLEDMKLGQVSWKIYDGFSSHCPSLTPSKIAISRGAKIIEHHFTLDRNLPGPDQSSSIEPKELEELVKFAREAEEVL